MFLTIDKITKQHKLTTDTYRPRFFRYFPDDPVDGAIGTTSTKSELHITIKNSTINDIKQEQNITCAPRPKSSSCTFSHLYCNSKPRRAGCVGSIRANLEPSKCKFNIGYN